MAHQPGATPFNNPASRREREVLSVCVAPDNLRVPSVVLVTSEEAAEFRVQASLDTTNTPTYLLADGLGSIRGLTDLSGTVTGTVAYDVFGAVRASTGASSSFGFTYLRARFLNPALGRFLSRDTVQPNAPGSQGYNPYAYVANNPTTWVDPSGHLTQALLAACMTTGWCADLIATGFSRMTLGALVPSEDGILSSWRSSFAPLTSPMNWPMAGAFLVAVLDSPANSNACLIGMARMRRKVPIPDPQRRLKTRPATILRIQDQRSIKLRSLGLLIFRRPEIILTSHLRTRQMAWPNEIARANT